MADPLYSDYLRDPTHWYAPGPDYTAVNTILGHGATTQPTAILGLINVSLRLPLAWHLPSKVTRIASIGSGQR